MTEDQLEQETLGWLTEAGYRTPTSNPDINAWVLHIIVVIGVVTSC